MDYCKKGKLNKTDTDNPWKASRGSADDTGPGTADINEQIVRQTMGLLNKLACSNFDSLVEKFLKLPFEDNEERISSAISVLFEKAINEPQFSTAYAKMVHTIYKNSQETSKIFRKKILDQCQIEFQKTSTDDTDIKEISISIEKTDDKSKKESLREELEENITQMRSRSLGNVRFIGELYKLQMLTPRIMIDCVTMLLSMEEEDLECLCKLLTSVGLKLEEQIKDVETSNELKRKGGKEQEIKFAPEPKWFDKTFKKLYELSWDESISFRIRLLLWDVLELRQNNWKPRRDPNARKTFEKVRLDNIRKLTLMRMEGRWLIGKGKEPEDLLKSKRGAADADIDFKNEEIVSQSTRILNEYTSDIDSIVKKFLSLPFEDNDGRNDSVHTICKKSREASKMFRKKILDQCQKEFQKASIDEIEIKQIEIAIEKSDDVSKKEFLKKELEEKRTHMRRRSLENVNFIGELYIHQMLTLRIIIDYITMLLSSMDEVVLGYLCELLTFVGAKLEEEIKDVEFKNELKRKGGQEQEIKFAPEPKWLNKTFAKLYELSWDESLSSRTRCELLVPTLETSKKSLFLVPYLTYCIVLSYDQKVSRNNTFFEVSKNVLELRKNYWKPRRDTKETNTISEIRRDRSDVVKNMFAKYCFAKNLAGFETIARTKVVSFTFTGVPINQFIEILSRQTAEEPKKEKQIAAGILINSLISKRLVTKESVLKILQLVLVELPDIEIDVPKAVSNLAVFLVEIFHDEKNLLWLPPLATYEEKESLLRSLNLRGYRISYKYKSLKKENMETWTNLVVNILNILKNKLGKETVTDYYKEVSKLTGNIEWLEKNDSQDVNEDLVNKIIRVLDENPNDILTPLRELNISDDKYSHLIKAIVVSSWDSNKKLWDIKKLTILLPQLCEFTNNPDAKLQFEIWNKFRDYMQQNKIDEENENKLGSLWCQQFVKDSSSEEKKFEI